MFLYSMTNFGLWLTKTDFAQKLIPNSTSDSGQ